MRTSLFTAIFVVLIATDFTTFAADLQSGPAVGDFPESFYVRDVTGPNAGTSVCYRCNYSIRPVVSVFVRNVDGHVAQLVKKLDSLVGENKDRRLAAFVVLLTDDPESSEATLKSLAEQQKLQNTPLTVFANATGPKKYRISPEADVTVLMWAKNDIKANHAYRIADLDEAAITRILGDSEKIMNLPPAGATN